MVIDSHAHVMLPVEEQITSMNQAGVDKTILFSTTPHPERAGNLAEFEKEMGVLYSILNGNRTLEERMDSIRRTTLELHQILPKYPDRFLGFGAVPLSMNEEMTSWWIEENVLSRGLRGVGEFSMAPGQVCLLENVFSAIKKLKSIPIWVHTFHPLGLSDLKDLAALAQKYSDIPIVFGHMGGVNWLDAIKMAIAQKNIYLDLSAVFTSIAPSLAIRELPDRTLFSSDAPYGDPELARIMVERLSPDKQTADRVLGGNIAQLLEIE